MQLYIGNKNYSSWSLRPWLLMRQAGIPSLNTTHVSIEEIASKIFDRFGIERTMF